LVSAFRKFFLHRLVSTFLITIMAPNRRYTASKRRYAAFSMFLVFVQLCKLIMRNRQGQVDLLFSEPRSNSEDKLAFYLSTLRGKKRRKAWAYARSTEWIRLLIRGRGTDGKPTAPGIFEGSFRMTRNSFEQLHALLGISSTLKFSDFRTVYRVTRYNMETSGIFQGQTIGILVPCLPRKQLYECIKSIRNREINCQ
jgi:hypothetical protein